MSNPYASKGRDQFWKRGVATIPASAVAPIRARRFTLPSDAVIATAGSCFAQNVSKYLDRTGLARVMRAEPVADDQPAFSALYGNIYTPRQLLQLYHRAFRGDATAETAWQRPDGAYVDPFRPSVFPAGFSTPEKVAQALEAHLRAVRTVFTECTTFVFTLGLTECWVSNRDGAVFPVAPGVISDAIDPNDYRFHNLTYSEILDDMRQFLSAFRTVNPSASVLLTVSPVPLTATYTDEHILGCDGAQQVDPTCRLQRAGGRISARRLFPVLRADCRTLHAGPLLQFGSANRHRGRRGPRDASVCGHVRSGWRTTNRLAACGSRGRV